MINDIALAVSTARSLSIERLDRRIDPMGSACLFAGIEKSADSPNLNIAFSLLRQRLAGGSMVALLSRRLGSAGIVRCNPAELILRRVFGARFFCKSIEQGAIVSKYIQHQRATSIQQPIMFGRALRVNSSA